MAVEPDHTPETILAGANALEGWVRRPEGHDLVVRYPAYRFVKGEGWGLRAHGPMGDSRLSGRFLHLDYTQGAQAFSLVPPDRVLPGNVDRVWLRVYGSVRP